MAVHWNSRSLSASARGAERPVAQSVLGGLTLGVAFDLTDPALEAVLRTLVAGRADLYEANPDEAEVTITDRPASLGGVVGPHRVLRVGADEVRRNAIDSLDPVLILAAATLIGAGYALERDASEGERTTAAVLPRLSQRERQVAALLVDGASNKVIARELDISVHTAKFHVTAILDKLQARNRADAVSILLREGLVAI
ncbi:LuxR C-terminal-related transcriptional regulator [Devosia sp. ZB163]|uniref:helix-turn-helix transcriptional regulator n=1 Tax=Devosia sp. ZB163 TaxID=3025938 RepID=UPI00235FB76C|nr:LuxR C-terminal-related transcriptional regulator [Devosia sp. ZB163]MDC9823498.1 LuxR C-terminal-related transcriptional regulator [Devosia sp. ZB163]